MRVNSGPSVTDRAVWQSCSDWVQRRDTRHHCTALGQTEPATEHRERVYRSLRRADAGGEGQSGSTERIGNSIFSNAKSLQQKFHRPGSGPSDGEKFAQEFAPVWSVRPGLPPLAQRRRRTVRLPRRQNCALTTFKSLFKPPTPPVFSFLSSFLVLKTFILQVSPT